MHPHSGVASRSCYRHDVFVCQQCAASFTVEGFCVHDGTPLRPEGDDPLIGALIGPYRIEKLIGVGGMGQVYKAVHPKIGSRVAVKVLAHGPSVRKDLIARFFDEARAVNVIRHENIVNILDLDYLPDRRPYIVMEFLDGSPLTSIINSHDGLPIGTVLRMISGSALSLTGRPRAMRLLLSVCEGESGGSTSKARTRIPSPTTANGLAPLASGPPSELGSFACPPIRRSAS